METFQQAMERHRIKPEWHQAALKLALARHEADDTRQAHSDLVWGIAKAIRNAVEQAAP